MVRYRSTATSMHGMVASSHPLASMAGARILIKGGNAFDAAIATNAALNVTQPHVCGVAGDAFFLNYDSKSGHLEFLNASGRASRNATISFYREKGLESIPQRGVLSALEVPGCVDGWCELNERHGLLLLADLLAPAILLAEEGFPTSHNLSDAIARHALIYQGSSREWFRIFTRGGSAPMPGEVLKQPDLGWTLRQVAAGGREAFYQGEVAERICAAMKKEEGLLDAEDLASHKSTWGEPVSLRYRDEYTIYETAPNSQALTALIAFNILSHFELKDLRRDSAEYLALMIEASKKAYEYRDRFITDPLEMSIDPSGLLLRENGERDATSISDELSEQRRRAVAGLEIAATASVKPDGDTTYFSVVDEDHNCVSCIQSLYMGFGSGCVPDGTGINLQNRGSYFSLDQKHHNRLQPGRRTFHTLCASLTTRRDHPYLVFGTMGGDIQPQVHQQVISAILDFGEDIQQAIEDPRWVKPGTIYEHTDVLLMESRFPERLRVELTRFGYHIKPDHALSSNTGHAQGIVIDEKSCALFGGADPRGDGAAIGI